MDLTDLGYFLAVAHRGSFSGAAQHSHVSPAAVSKAIQRLEDDLGAALFVRTTRSVSLTDAGRLLLERGQRITTEVQDARAALEGLSGSLRGPLRIAAMEVFSVELLPRGVAQLVLEAEQVVPELYEMHPAQMIEHLSEGTLDVAFTIGGRATPTVACEPLGTSRGVLVCGRSHPLYPQGRVRKADLQQHASVVPRLWAASHLDSLDQFDEQRYPRRIGATIELLQSAVQLAVSGRFLAYFPEISVRQDLRQGDLKALAGLRGLPPFELQILTRRSDTLKPAVERLRQIVVELVALRRAITPASPGR